jgi:acetoin utilization deacetylase AcuC-like enzyme
MLEKHPRREDFVEIQARDASFQELAWIHEEDYIRSIRETSKRSFTMLDPDTSACAESFAAAVRAAGGTIEGVEAVLSGSQRSSFSFVRPPGHHAEAARAMGFCLFNNVAIAATYAVEKRNIDRVLIIDWDIHHGNGTMHSFYNSRKIMYFSVHQYPHYPGTGLVTDVGVGEGKGFTVNVPLPGGQGDAEYLAVFQRVFIPIARQFEPELILISAGFDAHEYDPLAGMALSSQGYGAMTEAVMVLAKECCAGRIACVLEGGYDLTALAEGTASVLSVLSGQKEGEEKEKEQDDVTQVRDPFTLEAIEQVLSAHRPYWSLSDHT